MSSTPAAGAFACPVPIADYERILLAHGGGGKLTHDLIRRLFLPLFGNRYLEPLHDGAVVPVNGGRIALTTDAYVVDPLFFPGGDIGRLAVNGTVNDLAMCGAAPLYLTASFLIEEGFSTQELLRVAVSMRDAAAEAGVSVVTGDTKVVERGKGDKLFIITSGAGTVAPGTDIAPSRARPGDAVILNGPVGRHGIAIMSVREGLEFAAPVESDTAPLNGIVASMLKACPDMHVMRDPTRGGVAGALNEIAESARLGIEIDEDLIPLDEAVAGACEILGLDPLYVANEGKVIAVAPGEDAEKVVSAMRNHPYGRASAIVGEVVDDHPGVVVMRTRIGGRRIVDMMGGEQLPRIC